MGLRLFPLISVILGQIKLWSLRTVLTANNDRLALYTLSTLLNIESSSGGGRLERDHAAATFWTSRMHSAITQRVPLETTYSDNAHQQVNVDFLRLDEVCQRVRLLFGLFR